MKRIIFNTMVDTHQNSILSRATYKSNTQHRIIMCNRMLSLPASSFQKILSYLSRCSHIDRDRYGAFK